MEKHGAPQRRAYIREIDGLRAIAVLAVILNHINKQLLPGGFLGVDVFFVISGFVITLSLNHSWKKQNFLAFVTRFYGRRAKRILPALIIYILIFSMLITFFNQDPQSSLRIGSHALFGISNLSLHAGRSDYFAPNETLNPFLQTWSLGVEEQFYIIFPLVFYFIFIFTRGARLRVLATTTGVISAASFLLFLHLFGIDTSSLYYLPGFRFWEMGVGVIAYWAHSLGKQASIGHKTLNILESATFFVLALCFCFPESYAASSIPAAVISMGIFLTLRPYAQNTNDASQITKILSVFPLRRIGEVSYSLYLWHWGIICIASWTIGVTIYTTPLLLAIMAVTSYLSYQYVEVPFRKWKIGSHRVLLASVASVLAAFGGIKALSANSKHFYLGKRAEGPVLPNCSGDKSSDYWIYGDSHTYEMQKAVAGISSPANCYRADQDHYPEDKALGVESRRRSTGSITRSSFHILDGKKGFGADVLRNKPSYVIINKYWLGSFGKPEEGLDSYDSNNLRFFSLGANKTISHEEVLSTYIRSIGSIIKVNSSIRFVIVAPEPEFNWVGEGGPKNIAAGICDPQWFNFGYGTPLLESVCKQWNTPAYIMREVHAKRRKRFMKELSYLLNNFPNTVLFDTVPHLCTTERCSTHAKDGTRLYQDDDHLAEGSISRLISPLKRQMKTFKN